MSDNTPTKNKLELSHGGDLGDTVYAIPTLRRLARPAHMTLYPNHGVTRALMDERNASMLLPLLNVQNDVSGDWKPTHASDGLRLDFAVRRFYKNGLNLADIHSHWAGHDHWHGDHPWLTVDHAAVSPYTIVVARSARYRNDRFPWEDLVKQFEGRACFIGVDWEHQDFENRYGPIPRAETPTLLEAARVMAAADMVICNQSCPRAVAEGLKTPVIVEVGNPNNTHFGRDFAWYPELGGGVPSLDEKNLARIWCESASRRSLGFSVHHTNHLTEIARLCRSVRHVAGSALEIGTSAGGSAATIAWALNRTIHVVDDFYQRDVEESVAHLNRFLSVYHHKVHVGAYPSTVPDSERFAFVHIDTQNNEGLKTIFTRLLPKMSPGGIIATSGFSARVIGEAAPVLGKPTPISSSTNFPGIYAFQIGAA